jgi:hypothetical protein
VPLLELARKAFHPALGIAVLGCAANRRVRVADELVAGQWTIESGDLAVSAGVDELEAGEIEQQCAGEAGVASPPGRVAALLVIERDQQRLLGEDEPHGRTLAETRASRGFTFVLLGALRDPLRWPSSRVALHRPRGLRMSPYSSARYPGCRVCGRW